MGTAGSSYCVQKIIARRTHHPRGWHERNFQRKTMLHQKPFTRLAFFRCLLLVVRYSQKATS